MLAHAPVTPKFPSGSNREIVGGMLRNKCVGFTTFHTITTGDANGWCRWWPVWSAPQWIIVGGVDHTRHYWHHLSASLIVIVWKVLGRYLFPNIIPNNFMVGTGWEVWCDRAMRWLGLVSATSFKILPACLRYVDVVQFLVHVLQLESHNKTCRISKSTMKY